MKKYELDKNDYKEFGDKKLYRIVSLIDFSDVKEGDKGGHIENESNLSHEGDCWLYDRSIVCGPAKVQDDATLHHNSIVTGNSTVGGNALVEQDAIITGCAVLTEGAHVFGTAVVDKHIIACPISRPFLSVTHGFYNDFKISAIITEDYEILYTLDDNYDLMTFEFVSLIEDTIEQQVDDIEDLHDYITNFVKECIDIKNKLIAMNEL